MTAVVDPAALIAGHRCNARCRRAAHVEVVWLAGQDGPDRFDQAAISAGIVLAAISRPRSRPSAPLGLTARHSPWLVSWARTAPAGAQAATDAPDKVRAGVGLEDHHGEQLELRFDAGPRLTSTQRPRSGT